MFAQLTYARIQCLLLAIPTITLQRYAVRMPGVMQDIRHAAWVTPNERQPRGTPGKVFDGREHLDAYISDEPRTSMGWADVHRTITSEHRRMMLMGRSVKRRDAADDAW